MNKEVVSVFRQFPLPLFVTDNDGEQFEDFCHTYYKKYVDSIYQLKSTPVILQPSSKVGPIVEWEYQKIEFLCQEMQSILVTYLEGHPAKAFFLFESVVEKLQLSKDLLKLNIIKINKYTSFFRAQKNYTNAAPAPQTFTWNADTDLTASDIFHAPFNKRKRVGTNRFSIPGYPCLYISDALVTSYLECTQYGKAPINSICLRNNRPLYIADISPIDETFLNEVENDPNGFQYMPRLLNYARVFPLIAACHTKIDYVPAYDDEVKFKVEYILPQLLLQWFQKYSGRYMDGVKYMSCTAHANNTSGYNYILATQFFKGNTYCPKLSILFNSSPIMKIGLLDEDINVTQSFLEGVQKKFDGSVFSSIIN